MPPKVLVLGISWWQEVLEIGILKPDSMFKGITFREFNKTFRNEVDCRQYLFDLKFKDKYLCRKCGGSKYRKGRTSYHARCKRCGYDESYTAHTIFHKIQIPLLKAFSMAFQIAVFKKGISSMELAKLHGINQKTAWTFKRKVQHSMGLALAEDDNLCIIGKDCRLDSITLKRNACLSGLQRVNLVFQKNSIAAEAFQLVRCKGSIPNSDEIDGCHLIAGKYIDEGKDIRIWNFKIWLTAIHHHCSEKYLQGYLDEFFFRYNFRHHQKEVWHYLITAMIGSKPYSTIVRAA